MQSFPPLNKIFSKIFFPLFVFFVSYNFLGQEPLKIDDNYFLFEVAKTKEPVIIVNDSTGYSGFNFETRFKINFPKDQKINDFRDYIFQVDSINYFVIKGCGIVLKFENNEFERIDNSFNQRNQFGAVPFIHNKRIHLWGGYGLFTLKNFTTYFDFISKEWLLTNTKNKKEVTPRSYAFFYKTEDNLYVFGGQFKDGVNENKTDFYVRNLDLKTSTWSRGKKINPNLPFFSLQQKPVQFQYDNKLVIILDEIWEIDLFEGSLKKYEFKNFKSLESILYHPKNNSISFTYAVNDDLYVDNISYDDFKGNMIAEEPLYVKERSMVVVYTVLLLLSIIIVIYLSIKMYKKYKTKKNELVYIVKKDAFYTYKKEALNLTSLSKEVLKVFINQQYDFLELQTLNTALSKDVKDDNYVTINKRRERVLKDLKFELSNILKIQKGEVFSTRNSELDKRVKEIRLNMKIRVK